MLILKVFSSWGKQHEADGSSLVLLAVMDII